MMKIFNAIGLMSGTSMDGIDAAILRTDGEFFIENLAHISIPYEPEIQIMLKACEYMVRLCLGDLDKVQAYFQIYLSEFLSSQLNVINPDEYKLRLMRYFYRASQQEFTFFNMIQLSTYLHHDAVNKLLNQQFLAKNSIDIIGYHGQTLYHQPQQKVTIQIGDGSLLAKWTCIAVVNEFRQNDIQHGGQGAPLAPLYHRALVVNNNLIPAVVINCGGIANITVIHDANPETLIGFDCGPGNVLLDSFIRYKTNGRDQMDKDGMYGRAGKINPACLQILEKESLINNENYYSLKPPKSLNVSDFILPAVFKTLSIEDGAATLSAFTCMIIAASIEALKLPRRLHHCILVGGGWRNVNMLENLKHYLNIYDLNSIQIYTAEDLGWNNQAIEAELFAYLAVRSLQQLPLSYPNTTHAPYPLTGGKLHQPTFV